VGAAVAPRGRWAAWDKDGDLSLDLGDEEAPPLEPSRPPATAPPENGWEANDDDGRSSGNNLDCLDDEVWPEFGLKKNKDDEKQQQCQWRLLGPALPRQMLFFLFPNVVGLVCLALKLARSPLPDQDQAFTNAQLGVAWSAAGDATIRFCTEKSADTL
jgi:hypothetical protein